MSLLRTWSRARRWAIAFLIGTLALLGLEAWGIRSAILALLR